MDSSTMKFAAGDNNNITSGMPTFISQTPPSNSMGTEANGIQPSRLTDYGVLEQYLGFRGGDSTNVGRSSLYNPTAPNNQIEDPGLQANPFNKNLAPSIPNFFTNVPGQPMQFQKGPPPNLASASGAQHENWAESNMADSSSRTDTSGDLDPDDRNQRNDMGQSTGIAVSDNSSDKSKEKNLDQKTLRRLAQNREAARKSRLRKKAYVQQLENSRLKLSQLEQELQRARQQGVYISNSGDQSHGTSGNGLIS